ncbi:histidine phosphatase family protein [Actinokineospora spheciospongiae]|uniref:histidine phosphatase family protein n=1 Tax=Actinokineospora spheciospongiae TaxID=909613 RepID=UPI000D8E1C2E|nr:histidine phosphatase family protein [Actinokineospora spheciospongiae]PWW56899.1 broad specificity phosphatase PhoE [Actinokineospora spheciospongiae]
MGNRLTLVGHGPTAATRVAAFPVDEPLSDPGPVSTAGLGRVAVALRGPETRCAQTATALGLAASVDDRLRDLDFGAWRGRTLDEVAAAEPAAVTRWLTDPAAAPHGGESLADLVARVGGWLDERPTDPAPVVAVTHPSVVRAALVHALGADPAAYWRIDVVPLSRTVLRGGPGRWSLRWLSPAGQRDE